MTQGERGVMSILIDTFRELSRRLHSHLAAALTMFPFLMAPGRCVLVCSEPRPLQPQRAD
ncbi:MAG TPA: hypothetical protein VHP11_10280 [Tepidisphaeraceae bacterium]|nr:hypothetical protein [Tepidisphaeraceae bacterium]